MPSFASIKAAADTTSAVHKALEAVAFMALPTVALPAAITGVDKQPIDLVALGYKPVGIVTPDGYTFGGDVNKADVEALGYSTPVRSDIISAPKTISFTALESDRRFLSELLYGMDLSAIAAGATNGEVVFDEPAVPIGAEYRLLVIARDGTAAAPYYRGRGYGRVKIGNVPEEVWSAADPRQYPIQLDVLTDNTIGTPVRHYIGGAGFDPLGAGYLKPWAATTAYSLGSRVTFTGGSIEEATTAGTSGATQPAAPATIGATVTDGTVTWTRRS